MSPRAQDSRAPSSSQREVMSSPSRTRCGRTVSDVSGAPNPDSFLQTDGRVVELKVHRCLWSGTYSENSLLAIDECARENVLRVEIDVQLLRDAEFVVFHDDRFDRVTDRRGLLREGHGLRSDARALQGRLAPASLVRGRHAHRRARVPQADRARPQGFRALRVAAGGGARARGATDQGPRALQLLRGLESSSAPHGGRDAWSEPQPARL